MGCCIDVFYGEICPFCPVGIRAYSIHRLKCYLDDFIYAGGALDVCVLLMTSFKTTCNAFGITLNDAKRIESPIITFLGIVIDTDKIIIKYVINKLKLC